MDSLVRRMKRTVPPSHSGWKNVAPKMSLVTVIFTITRPSPVIRGYDSFIGESVGPWRLVCHITTWRISLGSIRNVEFPAFAHWRCHVVMVVCTEILILSNTLSPHLTRNDTMAQNWVCHCPLEATHSGKTLERIPILVTVLDYLLDSPHTAFTHFKTVL